LRHGVLIFTVCFNTKRLLAFIFTHHWAIDHRNFSLVSLQRYACTSTISCCTVETVIYVTGSEPFRVHRLHSSQKQFWTTPFRVLQNCQVRYLFFQHLQLGTEHHAWASINAPSWRSVNLSRYTHHLSKLGYSYRDGNLLQSWSDLDHSPLVVTAIFLPRKSKAMLAIWSEGLAKGLYQKNTPAPVRLKPAIHRL